MKRINGTTKTIGKSRTYFRAGVKKAMHQYPRIFSLIQEAIKTQKIEWKKPITVSVKPLITVQHEATGKYIGGVNYNRKWFKNRIGTFRLTINGQSYFLKYSEYLRGDLIEAHEKTRELLREIKHRIRDVNIRLIEPHLIFISGKTTNPEFTSSPGFIATRFFEEHQVTQIMEANPVKVEHLKEISLALKQLLTDKKISDEARISNFFYEEKTNTLWIYDL